MQNFVDKKSHKVLKCVLAVQFSYRVLTFHCTCESPHCTSDLFTFTFGLSALSPNTNLTSFLRNMSPAMPTFLDRSCFLPHFLHFPLNVNMCPGSRVHIVSLSTSWESSHPCAGLIMWFNYCIEHFSYLSHAIPQVIKPNSWQNILSITQLLLQINN